MILAALDLLNSWKQEVDEDPEIRDLMELLSRRVYVAAMLMLNQEEMAQLHEEVGGTPGAITIDPIERETAEAMLKSEIGRRARGAEEAWLVWRDSDFDAFEAIKNA